MKNVANVACQYQPDPIAMPMAAMAQSPAAVVKPSIPPCLWRIVPAPRKPIPTTICEATRLGSPPKNACEDKRVNRVEPIHTRA